MDVHPPVCPMVLIIYTHINSFLFFFFFNHQLAKMLIALVGKLAGLKDFDFKEIGK